jgi:hypothetical protein
MKAFRLFVFVFLFLNILAAKEVEYYTDRPQILKLEPRTTKKKEWINLNWAQTEFLAQLLGLYPTHHLYFLARDGEYLYDLALVLTKDQPHLRKRIHLINVSRLNQNDKLLKAYLQQSGVTEQKINQTGVVFVDTGFSGSIGKKIQSKYPSKVRDKMKIHLIESHVDEIPASEIFKIHGAMDAGSYEEMVRYFDRSDDFVKKEGRIVPVSPKGDQHEPYENDGTVDKKEALKFMRSTLGFGQKAAAQRYFLKRIQQWQYLSDLVFNQNRSLKDALETIIKIEKTWKHAAAQAMVEDFVDFYAKNSNRFFSLDQSVVDSQNQKTNLDLTTITEAAMNDVHAFAKKSTDKDLADLAYLLHAAFKQNEIDTFSYLIDQLDAKKAEYVLNELAKYLSASDLKKVFQMLIEEMPDASYKKWAQISKNLNIQSSSIKERLETMKINGGFETGKTCKRVVGY